MKKKGAALLVVVIITTAAFFIGAIVVDRSLKSTRRINENIDDMKAYYFAESLIYDMVSRISLHYNNTGVPEDLYRSNAANPYNIPVTGDSTLLSAYNVALKSGIARTTVSSSRTEYTYNIESTVVYNRRKYTVKLQVVTEYENGVYLRHRISDKRAFKL